MKLNIFLCFRFLAGSLAGSTGQMLTYPLDRARAVMAVTNSNGKQYKNLIVVFASIVREEGVIKLYRGLSPTLLGVIPYAGTSFFTYETLKAWTVRRKGGEKHGPMLPSPLERLGCGAVAGLLGQASSYPLDIARWVNSIQGKFNKHLPRISIFYNLQTSNANQSPAWTRRQI